MIRNSIFSNLGNVDNGGAICSSGRDLTIICCKFTLNYVTAQGGSIYFCEGVLNVSKTSFFECYSSANKNAVEGNAIRAIKKEVAMSDFSTFLCGMTDKLCSDSSISIESSKNDIRQYNATENYGVEGASFIQFLSCIDESFVEYCQAINCKDNYAITSVYNWYQACNCNFINTTHCRSIVWQNTNNRITFVSCLFWNIGNPQISNAGYALTLTNCLANCETSPTSTLSEFYPNKIIVNFKSCKFASKITCYVKRRDELSLSLFMMILLS